MLLAIKIVLVPIIIALVTVAGRVWGPKVSGVLAGLPVIAGPILIFLALDFGDDFAASSAQGLLLGVVSLGLFCCIYAYTCRHRGVGVSITVSILGFLISTYVLSAANLPINLSAGLVVTFLAVVMALFPRAESHPQALSISYVEILARMVTAALVVVLITSFGALFGARVSGLLAPFPVAGTVLAGFTHFNYGSESAIRLLRGFTRGLFGMALFAFVMAFTLHTLGLLWTIVLSCASALGSAAVIILVDRNTLRAKP